MKENRGLYSIATLASLGILISFIGYTTFTPVVSKGDLPPKTKVSENTKKSTPSINPSTTTPATKSDTPCGCCSERKARKRKRIEDARERRLIRQSATTKGRTQK